MVIASFEVSEWAKRLAYFLERIVNIHRPQTVSVAYSSLLFILFHVVF